MGFHYLWTRDDPVLRDRHRGANEARAAIVYALFGKARRALTAGFQTAVEALRRDHGRRRTYRVLSGLSDGALADIGLSRHELGDVAHRAAAEAGRNGVTLAALRGRSLRAREAALLPFERPERASRRTSGQQAEWPSDAA